MISSKSKWVLITCSLFIYWAAGLYPFRWSLPFTTYRNAAQRSPEGGWKFSGPGIVKTIGAPQWLSEAIDNSSLKVALEIRPAYSHQSGPARILSISKDPYHQNLIIAQEGTSLVLRLRTPQTNLTGIPSYRIESVFDALAWQRIDLLIERDQVQVSINGAQRLVARLPVRALSVWATDYSLALGNEMTFDRPWVGEIRRAEVSVGKVAIDYASKKSHLMHLPSRYYVIRDNIQFVPFRLTELNRSRASDWLLNLVGFVPFGLFSASLFRRTYRMRSAVIASLGLSASIEIGQLFVPVRFPAAEDVVLNVAGAALGAALAGGVLKYLLLRRLVPSGF